jgi:glycosyltransferase involved in cell wall biosynthesis
MKNKRLLVVAYYFPPSGGAGVQRTSKFCKYLSRLGWDISVITAKEKNYQLIDKSLKVDVGNMDSIVRVGGGSPLFFIRNFSDRLYRLMQGLLLLPDDQIFWAIRAYFRAKKAVKDDDITIIYTTSAPYSSHLVGYWLKKKQNVEWVADFRDEWVMGKKFMTPFHHKINCALEARIVKTADKILTVNSDLGDYFKDTYRVDKSISVIPNGFDREDFVKSGVENNDSSYIFYSGNLYAESIDAFNVFARAFKKHTEADPSATLVVATQSDRVFKKILLSNGVLENNYKILGYIEHSDLLRRMASSDALLLLSSRPRMKGLMPSKFFEYIGSGRFILNIGIDNSGVANFIRSNKIGVTALSEGDILKSLNQIKNIKANKHKTNAFDEYSRDFQAKELEKILLSL